MAYGQSLKQRVARLPGARQGRRRQPAGRSLPAALTGVLALVGGAADAAAQGKAPPRDARPPVAQPVAKPAQPATGPAAARPAQPESAGARPAAQPEGQPFLLTSDSLTYEEDGKVAVAKGRVEISRAERRLLADEVRYDQARDRVTARGNVALTEEGSDTFFGDEVEVTGDLRDGFIEGARMLRADDSRLAANRAVRTGGRRTELERAVYSPCPLCKEKGRPLWQLRARNVVHDQAARTVTYRGAVMELFGLPVAYAPWFRHPDPGVERQSGFLAPSFGASSELGAFVEAPYHYVLAPNRDLTLAPIVTQSAGAVLAGEYRELRAGVGRTELAGSVTYTDEHAREASGEEPEGKEVRGHVKGRGRYPVGARTQAGFDAELTTDDSYLERYNFSSDDVLENRAFVERVAGRDLLSLAGLYFQGLREEDDQDRIPVVLPLAEARRTSGPLRWGSTWTAETSLLGLTRASGLDTRRLSTTGSWQVPFVGAIGDLYRLQASLRGDAYNTKGDAETFSAAGDASTTGRVIPRLTGDWAWPLAGGGGGLGGWTYQVEPAASLSLAPAGGNDNSIPNEDSRDFEFDDTNLFEADRFPGLDRVEGGGKLAYGARFSAFGPRALQVAGSLGQSLRAYGSSPFPEGSGLEDPLSDYVGRVELRPSQLLDLGFRFRVAKDELELRRSDLNLAAGPSWLRVTVDYINLTREPSRQEERGFESREELVLGARTQVTSTLALGAQTRRDLTRDATVASQFGLLYTHPCLTVLAGLERSFTTTGEVDDETTALVRLAFRNLGEIETGSFLGLN